MYNDLPMRTLITPENRSGGLLLCGLNFGESDADRTQATEIPAMSFFGDLESDNYSYQNTIVKWFALWGYPLARTKAEAGPFERSLVSTNWLQTASQSASESALREYLDDSGEFSRTCEALKPSVVFFFGQKLMDVFTSPELSEQVEAIFGARLDTTRWKKKEVSFNGKLRTRFRVGFQKYERLTVVAFPHPTGCCVAHDYIAAFKPEITTIIEDWWRAHSGSVEVGSAEFKNNSLS